MSVLTNHIIFWGQSDQKIEQKLPNIWKCGQNCSLNIQAQIESPKHIHPTSFEYRNKYNKPCFETAYFANNVKRAKVKSGQTVRFCLIWSHCLGSFPSVF